jgi:arylsulfatase A-like enzyme
VNAHLLSWIDGLHDRTFFGFVNYFDVHGHLFPQPPYLGRSLDVSRRPAGEPGVALGAITGEFQRLTPEQIQADIDAYDESILYLDAQIGSLLDELKKRGKLDNTLVILTSDHGESFGEHGFYFHGHSLYREQVNVPMLLRWPRISQPARTALSRWTWNRSPRPSPRLPVCRAELCQACRS